MKNKLLVASTVLFVGSSMLFTGCKKDDTTAPSITLTGASSVSIDLGDTYADAGATANDDKDGNITSSISTTNPVDPNKVGTYIVKYNVSDAAGNSASEVTRTVKVKSDKLAGTYAVIDVVTGSTPSTNDGTYNYNVTVTQSSTDYNKLLLGNFGGVAGASVVAIVDGTNITIATQALTGSNPATSVSGTSGTYTVSGGIAKITNIKYSASNAFYGVGDAAYTKQ